MKPNGLVLLNTALISEEIKSLSDKKDINIDPIDATAISEKIYGQASIPRVNVAMLGHFAACTKAIKVESVLSAVDDYFTGDNAAKAKEGVKLAYSIATESKENRAEV